MLYCFHMSAGAASLIRLAPLAFLRAATLCLIERALVRCCAPSPVTQALLRHTRTLCVQMPRSCSKMSVSIVCTMTDGGGCLAAATAVQRSRMATTICASASP